MDREQRAGSRWRSSFLSRSAGRHEDEDEAPPAASAPSINKAPPPPSMLKASRFLAGPEVALDLLLTEPGMSPASTDTLSAPPPACEPLSETRRERCSSSSSLGIFAAAAAGGIFDSLFFLQLFKKSGGRSSARKAQIGDGREVTLCSVVRGDRCLEGRKRENESREDARKEEKMDEREGERGSERASEVRREPFFLGDSVSVILCILFSFLTRSRHAAQPLRRDVHARRQAWAHGRRRGWRRSRQERNDNGGGPLGPIDSAPTRKRQRRHAAAPSLADLLEGRAHLLRRHCRRLGRGSRALGRGDGPVDGLHAEEEAPERRRQAQARRERGRGIGHGQAAAARAWRRRRRRAKSFQRPAAKPPRKLPPPAAPSPGQAPPQDLDRQRRVRSQHPSATATLAQGRRRQRRRRLFLVNELVPLDARGRRDGGRRPARGPGPAKTPLAAEGRAAVVEGRDPMV